ncbi:MAG: hypothetical protein WCH99_15095 [Verrucomicrobiota bacterium]
MRNNTCFKELKSDSIRDRRIGVQQTALNRTKAHRKPKTRNRNGREESQKQTGWMTFGDWSLIHPAGDPRQMKVTRDYQRLPKVTQNGILQFPGCG